MPWVALYAVSLCAFVVTATLLALAWVTWREWDKYDN